MSNPRHALLPTPVDADRVPTRRRGQIKLYADGQRAASGISSHYSYLQSTGFPPELAGVGKYSGLLGVLWGLKA